MSDAPEESAEALPAPTGPKIRAAGIILLVVAVASFVTALFMNNQKGQPLSASLPPIGGQIGPYEFEANEVLDIEVHQSLEQKGWSFVDVEIENADEEYLFGFGDELWWETGVDSEGYSWNESVKMYDLKVTIPEAGTYYLDFSVEYGLTPGAGVAAGGDAALPPPETVLSDIAVRITPKAGSALPHLILGVVMLLLGIIVTAVGQSRAQREELTAALAT